MTGRTRLTGSEIRQLWSRWRQGESVTQIAEALGRAHTSVSSIVQRSGGFAPRVRRRCPRALTLSEREEISRGIGCGLTVRAIASALGRCASTVAREIARNGGLRAYRACRADARAWERARRPKCCKLALQPQLCAQVARKLSEQQWSPQQIARWLARCYPNDHSRRVSHETIYKALFIQARAVLKQELCAHLRSQRRLRRAQSQSTPGSRRGQIIDAVSIRERPAEVEDRAVPGHWEGDLLCGGPRTQIATLVERHSRYLMLIKVPRKDTATVVKALSRRVRTLPIQLRRSLTWDRGLELAEHKAFTLATHVKVYFCDPQSPWQRGSNENLNGLLRQYFPKGSDLSAHSQAYLDQIAKRLNTRPRETLGWDTPAFRLNATLRASTG